MNFAAIYNEVATVRFNSSAAKIAQIKTWVNQAEAKVWNAGEWTFKRPVAVTLAVVANNNAPVMPTDFSRARVLIDNNGDEVEYLPPDEFDAKYLVGVSPGPPQEFTVTNRQILLGPTPSASASFKLGYRRRYAHLNSVGTVVAGPMTADTDTPIWDAEFHYILVPWAILLGAQLEGEAAPQRFKEERDELLTALRAEQNIPGVDGATLQYG